MTDAEKAIIAQLIKAVHADQAAQVAGSEFELEAASLAKLKLEARQRLDHAIAQASALVS